MHLHAKIHIQYSKVLGGKCGKKKSCQNLWVFIGFVFKIICENSADQYLAWLTLGGTLLYLFTVLYIQECIGQYCHEVLALLSSTNPFLCVPEKPHPSLLPIPSSSRQKGHIVSNLHCGRCKPEKEREALWRNPAQNRECRLVFYLSSPCPLCTRHFLHHQSHGRTCSIFHFSVPRTNAAHSHAKTRHAARHAKTRQQMLLPKVLQSVFGHF